MSHWNQCLRQIPFGYHFNILILLILVFIKNHLSYQNVCTFSFMIYWLIIYVISIIIICTLFFNSFCFKYTQYFIVPTWPLDDDWGDSHKLARTSGSRTPQGLYSLRRRRLTGIGIPIINLRRSDDRLRFIMGIPILIRRRLLSE